MHPYCEALFIKGAPDRKWQDISTPDFYIFSSSFGRVALRKRHSYPATFAFVRGSRLFFGYGNMLRARQLAYKTLHTLRDEDFYDEEFLYAEADAALQTVTLQRDALSTLPLFAGAQTDRLVLCERYERVCSQIDRNQASIDTLALVKQLCFMGTYERTLCTAIRLLYDRMRMEWSGQGGYRISLPSSSTALKAAHKQRNGDVRELRLRIDATLAAYWQRYTDGQVPACDLSGGMDSAAIAGYFARQNHAPLAITMLFTGADGERQKEKLQAMERHFGFSSHKVTLDPLRHHPLQFLSQNSNQPFYHFQQGSYYAAYEELLAWLSQRNVAAVFTGIGGDELCEHIPDFQPYSKNLVKQFLMQSGLMAEWWTPRFMDLLSAASAVSEREPDHPLPLTSYSVAGSNANDTAAIFSLDIWPVAPLADPRLYAYTQSLPLRYRAQRNLTRMYLRALNFPPVIYDNTTEDMVRHHHLSILHNLLGMLRHYLTHSVLAEHGLVDTKRILNLVEDAAKAKAYTKDQARATNAAFSILVAEANIKALGIPFNRQSLPQVLGS